MSASFHVKEVFKAFDFTLTTNNNSRNIICLSEKPIWPLFNLTLERTFNSSSRFSFRSFKRLRFVPPLYSINISFSHTNVYTV